MLAGIYVQHKQCVTSGLVCYVSIQTMQPIKWIGKPTKSRKWCKLVRSFVRGV